MAKTRYSSLELNPSTRKDDTNAIDVKDSSNTSIFTVGLDGLITAGGLKVLTATVGTSKTTIAHGLGRVPRIVIPVARSATAVYVCEADAPDATNIYLIASAANTTVKVYVA